MKLEKREKGITLVALIITIIILIILATVTIMTLTKSRMIDVAIEGAQNYQEAQYQEVENINKLTNKINNAIEGIQNANNGNLPDNPNPDNPKPEEDITFQPIPTPEQPTDQITTTQFERTYGVVDIIWLDMENNKINSPMSPKDYLGGLKPIKYDEVKEEWVNADINNNNYDWYNYEAQTGTKDGRTSKWANARTDDEGAYFVWIPRYAYKITYFDTQVNANAYREDKNSTKGIIGYSSIEGMIDITSGERKLVEGTAPTNVKGKVKTANYSGYIPHPGFEFDKSKPGIWVGKLATTEQPDTRDLSINLSDKLYFGSNIQTIFNKCQAITQVYNITGDSHIMKNTEWGAIAYLTESRYGRNGKTVNYRTSYIKDWPALSKENEVFASTSGNIYGV